MDPSDEPAAASTSKPDSAPKLTRPNGEKGAENTPTMAVDPPEVDDFGLPIKRFVPPVSPPPTANDEPSDTAKTPLEPNPSTNPTSSNSVDQNAEDPSSEHKQTDAASSGKVAGSDPASSTETPPPNNSPDQKQADTPPPKNSPKKNTDPPPPTDKLEGTIGEGDLAKETTKNDAVDPSHTRNESLSDPHTFSEFSHQQLTVKKEKEGGDDGEWQEMPSYAPYDIYDDDNKLIAKEHNDEEDEKYGYAGLGGAGKGYTRVLLDDDAESATSMDENTQYLFKNAGGTSMVDDDHQRDAVSQLQATKDLLTEVQRIAYVGLTRLELSQMVDEAMAIDPSNKKKPKKEIQISVEALKMWSQKMMIRLYSHMDISPAEQVMIEQLSEHGVQPSDLTGSLLQNSRVSNPMNEKATLQDKSPIGSPSSEQDCESPADPPPPYKTHEDGEVPAVQTPSQLPSTETIDIDLRWTVLCDLFLVLIADSVYDSRSRVLLERVGKDLEIPWLDICRFEKRVTDALEMQQAAEKENWNEEEHMESRRKLALKRRYVMMGLATVGGGLVIGLSAGLLAPMIGAGLAAGFTTIGVTGTSGFLAGTAGAAIITSGAAASGSYIGGKAANRRTGAVKTFEYRPLHNNKRVNLIVTVSGWMTGKVDDVRLPFSTVDSIMGDIYSILWEPEMLTSMGDTINILATEALTQGLQQVLGSTILISLMAALQLPVVLTKLSYLIDNPWAVSLDRATSAGLILADSLIDRNLGTRPVTLVGYSLGSRVIFSCLLELAKKGAYGLVQNVYIFGSPVVVKKDEFVKARTVVAGRFISGYNRNDWILGYLFRLTNGGIRRIAGLASVDEVAGIENVDVTEYVGGHMDYRTAMPRLLRETCGWLVESDEFTEIEDPDPENHQERQRELINEIEEARKELEKEGTKGKSRFSIFGRKKKLERAEWEVYEDNKSKDGAPGSGKTEDKEGNNHGVLFDVDAIRAELAKEAEAQKGLNGQSQDDGHLLQVKEIKSTLPPMRLNLTPSPSPSPGLPPSLSTQNPRDSLRETKSTSALPYRVPSSEYRSSFDERGGVAKYHNSPYTKSPANSYGLNDEVDDGAMEMTFDTTFREPSPASPAGGFGSKNTTTTTTAAATTSFSYNSSSGYGKEDAGFGSSNYGAPLPAYGGDGLVPEVKLTNNTTETGTKRPELGMPINTAPTLSATNPWADDDFDDPDFGKEQEISMTFA